MRIKVLKFGGTSVADPEKIHRAAERAAADRRRGWGVVVVVSAPGEMTDELLALGRRVSAAPPPRETDQLIATGEVVGAALFAMACAGLGNPAVSLTGPQAGIDAAGPHGNARLNRIRPARILSELRAGRVVVVAGFQGAGPGGDIATLGRGGSDLTAVALAARLGASHCEIFSDVRGVYTADPRIVSRARKLRSITFDEMLELSSAGAQVMQPRSIELARSARIPLQVRSAFHAQEGTWIVPNEDGKGTRRSEKTRVSSLALHKGSVRLSITGVPDRPGAAAAVLARLAAAGVPLDMIQQAAARVSLRRHARARNAGRGQAASGGKGAACLSFMTDRSHAGPARTALREAARALPGKTCRVSEDGEVAKVSVVGTGFRRSPETAARVFEALSRLRIDIRMFAAADLRISCVVPAKHAEAALRALHGAFGLASKR
ncbi:MAG: aspartate kinase [Elusimicrobia bacterium]|nr:aspartate kinase [Elusimicrobiota bacterium]